MPPTDIFEKGLETLIVRHMTGVVTGKLDVRPRSRRLAGAEPQNAPLLTVSDEGEIAECNETGDA
jgi:hypothetical protein